MKKRLILLFILFIPIAKISFSHPLGNFSFNHYTVLDIRPGEVITQHVLDFAEIPSFNELTNLDTDDDGIVTPEEIKSYKQTLSKRYLGNYDFQLEEAGGGLQLLKPEILDTNIILSQGQGALTCLQIRLTCSLKHSLLDSKGRKRFVYDDDNFSHIRGIQEIRIITHPGIVLLQEDITARKPVAPVPLSENMYILKGLDVDFTFTVTKDPKASTTRNISDITQMMDPRSIPQFPLKPDENGNFKILKSPIQANPEVQNQLALLQPRRIVSATDILANQSVETKEGMSSQMPQENSTDSMNNRSGRKDAEWAALIGSEELSPTIIFLAIFVSIIAGMSHALSPGHGKTVVAAYLVGSRGTIFHAVFLGLVVTMTHVSSVLILGFITLYFSQYIVPDKLYPIIESSSGVLIIVIGITIFLRRYSALQKKKFMQALSQTSSHEHSHTENQDHSHTHSHTHNHNHNHHPHSHEHDHYAMDHEHGPHTHTHDIPADATWKDLLILGITGGIVPCPAAILVLLGAIGLHRVLFGMLLIVFFSIGLAAVLITIGILMVTAKQLLDRVIKSENSLLWLQVVSPILVTVLGVVILIRGLQTSGIVTFHF